MPNIIKINTVIYDRRSFSYAAQTFGTHYLTILNLVNAPLNLNLLLRPTFSNWLMIVSSICDIFKIVLMYILPDLLF